MQDLLYSLDPDNFLGVENSVALKNQGLHGVGEYRTQRFGLRAGNRLAEVGGAA